MGFYFVEFIYERTVLYSSSDRTETGKENTVAKSALMLLTMDATAPIA